MNRLLAVARERGRDAWYLAAALAGLRKGDFQRQTWGDMTRRQDFLRAGVTPQVAQRILAHDDPSQSASSWSSNWRETGRPRAVN